MDKPTVIELPESPSIPTRGACPIAPLPPKVCEPDKTPVQYHDIIYIVNSHTFYLLTEEASSYIQTAEDKLAGVKGSDHKAKALSGISQGFTIAAIPEFLSKQDKARYDEILSLLEQPLPRGRAELLTESRKRHGYYIEQRALEDKAIDIATDKKHGYTYNKGQLFTPRESKIQSLLKAYDAAKKAFAKNKDIPPDDQVAALKKALEAHKAFITQYAPHMLWPDPMNYIEAEKQLAEKSSSLHRLSNCITDLQALGVAVPECALSLSGGDGMALLAQYFALRKEEETLEDALRQRLKTLAKAADYRNIPPSSILKDEYEKLKVLQKEANRLYNLAHQLASQHQLLLVWDVTDYKEKPVQQLVKDDFPLREFLLGAPKPGAETAPSAQLRYMSLADIPHQSEAGQPVNVSFTSRQDSDSAFQRILNQGLATPLKIESKWFDEHGLFHPDAFHAALAKQNIEVASLQADPSVWNDAVRGVVYRDFIKKRLDPFDSSYQAQYFRFSTQQGKGEIGRVSNYTYEKIIDYTGTTKTGEQSDESLKSVHKVEAKYTLAAARGELNLIGAATGKPYLSFPEESEIKQNKELVLTLEAHDKSAGKTFSFPFKPGLLRTRLYLKAYGFAGASLASEQNISLTPEGLRPFTTLKDKEVKLSLEANVGVEMACYLDWFLPSSVDDGIGVPDFIVPKDVKMLTTLKGSLGAEVGAEVSHLVPLSLRYVKEKLYLRFQVGHAAKLVIDGEIMPEAIGAWVWQFQRILRQANYHPVNIADDETFQALSTFSRACLLSQMQVGLFLAKGKDSWDKIMTIFQSSPAPIVAHVFTIGNEDAMKPWIQMMVPEGLAPLIETLLTEPEAFGINENIDGQEITKFEKDDVLAMQQIALMKIFMWLHDIWARYPTQRQPVLRQVEEALSRMQGNHELKAQRELDFMVNCDRVEAMLNQRVMITGEGKEGLAREYRRLTFGYSPYHFRDLTIAQYESIKLREGELRNEVFADLQRQFDGKIRI
ncbi:hypothetical protein [Grimontia marina]|uniref:Uncharacterized protein n=1 Tax=Grimontia marina TaxID=646534 RepID=A0A128EV90_9GAMM|nr:hypothetical protein [Grimontia marina]CZF77876.1 hypothetical protein GMA8713_00346 [Grimontia marina]